MTRLLLTATLLAACSSTPPPKPETPAPPPPEPVRSTEPPDRPPPIGVEPVAPEPAKPVEQKPQPPRLAARAVFSSLIGEKAPTVTITVTNFESYPIPIAKVAKPVCWLPLYTRAELTRPDGKKTEMKPCKDAKHTIEDLAPGASKEVTLNVSELFGAIGLGQFSVNFDWDSSEAAKLDEKLNVFGKLDQKRRDFIVAKLLSTFTIAKGKTQPIDGTKVKLLFVSHGHKSVAANGPGSPLLINAEIVENGKGREVYASIHTEDKELVNLDGYIFDVVEYKYDESMKLRYWGKLQIAN